MLAAFDHIIWDKQTLGVVGGCAVGLAAILGWYWYRLNKTRSDNELKRLMIERGMSADEIERVMAASSDEESDGGRAARAATKREARVT